MAGCLTARTGKPGVGRRWLEPASHLAAKPSERQWCRPDVLEQCKSSGQWEGEIESLEARLLMHMSSSVDPAERGHDSRNGCMKRAEGRSIGRGSVPRRYLFPFSYSSRPMRGGFSSLKPVGDAIKAYNSGQTKKFPHTQFCRGRACACRGRHRLMRITSIHAEDAILGRWLYLIS